MVEILKQREPLIGCDKTMALNGEPDRKERELCWLEMQSRNHRGKSAKRRNKEFIIDQTHPHGEIGMREDMSSVHYR